MTSLAIVPAVAGAAGSAPSSTSVTASKPSIVTGAPVVFTATVTAATPVATTRATRGFQAFRLPKAATGNTPVPSGTVTFSVAGSNATSLTCKGGDTKTLSPSGSATCKIAPVQAQAEASPYDVTADYMGDDNYATSSGSTDETVTKATSKTRLKVRPKVTNGSANTFTAKISAGRAGPLLAGYVAFAVSSNPATSSHLRKCAGGDVQPISVNGKHATATCVLSAGWFVAPKKTKTDPHPHGTYQVTATYEGNGNFTSSVHSKSGGAK
jgi:hypothetical protein